MTVGENVANLSDESKTEKERSILGTLQHWQTSSAVKSRGSWPTRVASSLAYVVGASLVDVGGVLEYVVVVALRVHELALIEVIVSRVPRRVVAMIRVQVHCF